MFTVYRIDLWGGMVIVSLLQLGTMFEAVRLTFQSVFNTPKFKIELALTGVQGVYKRRQVDRLKVPSGHKVIGKDEFQLLCRFEAFSLI